MKIFKNILLVLILAWTLPMFAQTETAPDTNDNATTGKSTKQHQVRYKKSKQVDFGNQTIEGKLRRPETSLITAGEHASDNGLLRLREDFVDKFTAFCGEEVQ